MSGDNLKWAFIAFALAAYLSGYVTGCGRHKAERTVEVRRDTVTVYDTVRLDHFREVTKTVTDTVWISVASKESPSDSILLHFADSRQTSAASDGNTGLQLDSNIVSVGLPHEQITVRDSLFTAQISGFRPHLDWIQLTTPTKVITAVERPKTTQRRWGFGITAGAGTVWNEEGIHTGLGAMVGVQYRF